MSQANVARKFTLLILFLSIWPATTALADARHFTFLYEAPISPPGSVELENTITWTRTTNGAACPVTPQMATVRKGRYVDVATLRDGRTLLVHRCIECHTLPPLWHYSVEDWPNIVNSMP